MNMLSRICLFISLTCFFLVSIFQSKRIEIIKKRVEVLQQAGEFVEGRQVEELVWFGKKSSYHPPHFKSISRLEDRLRTLEEYLNVSYVPEREECSTIKPHYEKKLIDKTMNLSAVDGFISVWN